MEKECCKNQENHKIKWILNRFEDWEPHFTYCEICKNVVEEHIVNR